MKLLFFLFANIINIFVHEDQTEDLTEVIMEKKIHVMIAYTFHIVLIVMSFAMMQSYYDALQISFLVLGGLYFIYWIIFNRKSYMPWDVYVHFGIGVFAQILLNCCGIIPKDGGLCNMNGFCNGGLVVVIIFS